MLLQNHKPVLHGTRSLVKTPELPRPCPPPPQRHLPQPGTSTQVPAPCTLGPRPSVAPGNVTRPSCDQREETLSVTAHFVFLGVFLSEILKLFQICRTLAEIEIPVCPHSAPPASTFRKHRAAIKAGQPRPASGSRTPLLSMHRCDLPAE